MTKIPFKRLVLAAVLGAGAAGPAWAGVETNTMNNIVTLTDACSIAAIGVDFGVTTFPIPAAGVTAVPAGTANNGTANAMSGNATHPYFGKDANDTLTLTSPVSALNGVLSTALSTVTSKLGTPGVYVVCTVAPSKVTLTSANGGAPAVLPVTTAGSVAPVTFSGKMIGVGGGAGAANKLDYSLMLTPLVVSTAVPGSPLAVFTGTYTMLTGTIPALQTGTPAVGQYWDGAVAEVDY